MSNQKSHGQTPMSQQAAARIQSTTAKASGGQISKGSFAARAQSAAARSATGEKGGGRSAK